MTGSQNTGVFWSSIQAGSWPVSMSLGENPVTGSEKLNRAVNAPDTGGSVSSLIPTLSGAMVIPASDSDQLPVPSSLVARTWTS